MAEPGKFETLCNAGDLYSQEFINLFGRNHENWSKSTWLQREGMLKLDMVCLLLCNTLPMTKRGREPDPLDASVEKIKRRRLNSGETSSSSSAKADSVVEDADGESLRDVLAQMELAEGAYRYILLRGKVNATQVQNSITSKLQLQSARSKYDIYDREERKFIKVSVSLDKTKDWTEFQLNPDPREIKAFVHMHPEDGTYTHSYKRDRMPGLSKATEFLVKRGIKLSLLHSHKESDLFLGPDLSKEIFVCSKFNESVKEWTNLFWEHREKEASPDDLTLQMNPIAHIREVELKNFIEDTSTRKEDFMTFPAKVLPTPFVSEIETNLETDSEMIDLLFKELRFKESNEKGANINWMIERWNNGPKNTFNFTTLKERKILPEGIAEDLGIGCKGTVRNDDHEDLRQKDFKPPRKARYSAWMDHLLHHLSQENGTGIVYFDELAQTEIKDDHPMARVASKAVSDYFKLFGSTNLAAYCSKVKSVYSRFGGAYLGKGNRGKDKPETVIFPIYSVGKRDEDTVRRLSGFAVRGPQHARSATDKIPFIVVESLDSNEGLKYRQFIRNSHIVYDVHGRAWSYRVNSLMKGSTSFLSFMANSAYLPANMLGELTVNYPNIPSDYRAEDELREFTGRFGRWLMERCSESVMMAVVGSSQEEGAMAIIRKIFMIKLQWKRGGKPLGFDTKGLADALNESLINSPFALYMGMKIRDSLC